MAGEKQDEVWPLPKFYFTVQLGDDDKVAFQEVSGLQVESKAIEYRHGNSKIFAPIKMPGMTSVGNVTLKKGHLREGRQALRVVQRNQDEPDQAADRGDQPARRGRRVEDRPGP